MYRSRGILAAHCPSINIYNQVHKCPSCGIKVTTEASIHPATSGTQIVLYNQSKAMGVILIGFKAELADRMCDWNPWWKRKLVVAFDYI